MNNRNIYSGFWKRFAAYFIDNLIVLFLAAIVGGILGFFYGATTGTAEGAELIGGLGGFITGWIFYAAFESSSKQATPGKIALNLKVVNLSHERVSFGQATGRYFAKIISILILMIGYLIQPFTSKKQCLHDILSDTLVLDDSKIDTLVSDLS